MTLKDKFFRLVDIFDKTVGTVALVLIVLFVFYQVMSRYFLGTSLRWSEEFSRFLMLYMIMIGLGAGIKRRKHLGVDAVVEALPGGARRAMICLAGLLSIAVYLVMMYYGWQMTLRTFRSGQVSPAAGVPMVLVYASLPLGFLMGALRQLDETYKVWASKNE